MPFENGGCGTPRSQMQHHQSFALEFVHHATHSQTGPIMAQAMEAVAPKVIFFGPFPRNGVGSGMIRQGPMEGGVKDRKLPGGWKHLFTGVYPFQRNRVVQRGPVAQPLQFGPNSCSHFYRVVEVGAAMHHAVSNPCNSNTNILQAVCQNLQSPASPAFSRFCPDRPRNCPVAQPRHPNWALGVKPVQPRHPSLASGSMIKPGHFDAAGPNIAGKNARHHEQTPEDDSIRLSYGSRAGLALGLFAHQFS